MYGPESDLAYLFELTAEAIDAAFGKGYAQSHPELVAAQLQAIAIRKLADAVVQAGSEIGSGLRAVADCLPE